MDEQLLQQLLGTHPTLNSAFGQVLLDMLTQAEMDPTNALAPESAYVDPNIDPEPEPPAPIVEEPGGSQYDLGTLLLPEEPVDIEPPNNAPPPPPIDDGGGDDTDPTDPRKKRKRRREPRGPRFGASPFEQGLGRVQNMFSQAGHDVEIPGWLLSAGQSVTQGQPFRGGFSFGGSGGQVDPGTMAYFTRPALSPFEPTPGPRNRAPNPRGGGGGGAGTGGLQPRPQEKQPRRPRFGAFGMGGPLNFGRM